MITFAQRVRNAENAAIEKSEPFMPSIAQKIEELQKLIDDMLLMSHDEAKKYVCETFRHIGLEATALRMYKEQFFNKTVL